MNIILQVDDGSHNLVVADTDFAIPERDGGAAVATLVLDEPGSYTFGCTVLGHVSEGMVGAITVT